ncbi:MAG: hypothetical protein Q9186_002689 [Xanthomendoza sp. 1 TL-2023]
MLAKETEPLSSLPCPPSAFSSNSTATKITLPAGTLSETATKIFCKRSPYSQEEIAGASNAAAFGLHVQIPHITSSGDLWYPFFEGETESELRLSLHRSGRSHWHAAETLLYAELVKAEDMLRVYSKCLTEPNMPKTEPIAQPIHRFFYFRLVEDVRFHQFYGDSISVGGKNLSREKFFETTWKINGVIYPSLGELFRVAMDVVHPSSLQNTSCPTVFGLGDAHGANVMISNDESPNCSREILYVDYEVAGFHPIMLDLAKAFYIDVFFNTVYMDILPEVLETKYAFEGNLIDAEFTPDIDDITQAVFDVKRRYLLQPLFDLALHYGSNLEMNVPLLSNALLLCATLTRNYSGHPAAFIRNMATGIVLAQAVDLEGFYSGLKSLGIGV